MWLDDQHTRWWQELKSATEVTKKQQKNYQKFTNNGKHLPHSRKHNTAVRKGKFP